MTQGMKILFGVLLVYITVSVVAFQIFIHYKRTFQTDVSGWVYSGALHSDESQFKTAGYFKCDGEWINTYKDFHAKSLSSSSKDRKFLIFYCPGRSAGCGGYGNRMFGIISTFYLAVVTNRTFLIQWGGKEQLDTYYKPNMIDWTYDERIFKGLKTRNTRWSYSFNNGYDRQIGVESDEFLERFQDMNLQTYFDVPVEKMSSMWYFAPRIWNNTSLKKWANHIGIPKPRADYPWGMIGCAMKVLFNKTNYLIKELRKANLELWQRPIIGIHIRTSDHHFGRANEYSYRTRDPRAVFACAQRVENALKRKNHILKNKTFTWFLATDNRKVKQEALSKYPNNIATLDVNPLHIDQNTGRDILHDLLLDQLLLLECDYFLPTWDSTFSYMVIGTRQFPQKSFVFGEKCNLDEKAIELSHDKLETKDTSRLPLYNIRVRNHTANSQNAS